MRLCIIEKVFSSLNRPDASLRQARELRQHTIARKDPIIRINPHPTLNIQDRKIFVLSANTLQYASR